MILPHAPLNSKFNYFIARHAQLLALKGNAQSAKCPTSLGDIPITIFLLTFAELVIEKSIRNSQFHKSPRRRASVSTSPKCVAKRARGKGESEFVRSGLDRKLKKQHSEFQSEFPLPRNT